MDAARAVFARLAAIMLIVAFSAASSAQTITGPAVVTGGGSIRITGERIRLISIDAPERRQTCRERGRIGIRQHSQFCRT